MGLSFRDIHHRYGTTAALRGISFDAAEGEVTCLLGPSGCGKTTLLRIAAGLLPLQQGEIWLDDAPLAQPGWEPAPENRPVGLVFQEGALFPHLTVAENIGFGVRDAKARAGIISDLLEQIGLGAFAKRYPHTLSGGQQQRVALARALAPSPRVLLLDEPFANIDIQRRRSLRSETRTLLKARACSAIMVTHDPEEAMDVADRIALMDEGRMAQFGTTDELYHAPATLTVASLISGAQPVKASRTAGGLETSFGLWPLEALSNAAPSAARLTLAVPAGALTVSPGDSSVRVIDERSTGVSHRLTLLAPSGEMLFADVSREQASLIGQAVTVTPKPGTVHAYTADIV